MSDEFQLLAEDISFKLYFILVHFHNNHTVFWVTVKVPAIWLIQKPELVSVKKQDSFVFWIFSKFQRENKIKL